MKKLTLIGGGSVRTYYFIESLLRFYRRMEIDEVAVMDTDSVKLRYFGGLARYLCAREKAELRVTLHTDAAEALPTFRSAANAVTDDSDAASMAAIAADSNFFDMRSSSPFHASRRAVVGSLS